MLSTIKTFEVTLKTFSLFSEIFIGFVVLYFTIFFLALYYNVFKLNIQKPICECLALVALMALLLACNEERGFYLQIKNTDFEGFNTTSFVIMSKLVVYLFLFFYFILISDSLTSQKLIHIEYLLILLLAFLGLVLLCSSNDLLTSYLSIELVSLSSYLLAAFRKDSLYSIEAGLKYFIVGSVSSAFFLLGTSIIYASTGSIDFTTFSVMFEQRGRHMIFVFLGWKFEYFNSSFPEFIELGILLILCSIFIKLALAPFHLWALDVYENSPTSSTFFFAIITKFCFFIFLIKFLYVAMFDFRTNWQFYSSIVALTSVFIGSFGGLTQRRLKTLLAYSSISHMGYSLLAFSTVSSFGVQILLFYLIIFLLSGLCTWHIVLLLRLKTTQNVFNKKYSKELTDLVLLKKSNAAIAFALSITMFSLAGLPPFIGFFSKFGVFIALLQKDFYFACVLSVLCSVVSTFFYIKIVKIIYFENVLIGKLYYPIKSNKTFFLSFFIFLQVFLFVNPNLLYMITHIVVFNSFN